VPLALPRLRGQCRSIPGVARRAGKFHVIGNFCSLSAWSVSNFDRNRGSDLAWERNMLINELSVAVGNGLETGPRPRASPAQFGGDMDTVKFRGWCGECASSALRRACGGGASARRGGDAHPSGSSISVPSMSPSSKLDKYWTCGLKRSKS
jgi:hypothetical protein